jgi:hypothetical protein
VAVVVAARRVNRGRARAQSGGAAAHGRRQSSWARASAASHRERVEQPNVQSIRGCTAGKRWRGLLEGRRNPASCIVARPRPPVLLVCVAVKKRGTAATTKKKAVQAEKKKRENGEKERAAKGNQTRARWKKEVQGSSKAFFAKRIETQAYTLAVIPAGRRRSGTGLSHFVADTEKVCRAESKNGGSRTEQQKTQDVFCAKHRAKKKRGQCI